MRRMEEFLVNLSAVEGNDLVLVDDLLDSLVEVSGLAVEETNGEVLGPLPRTENEQDAEDYCQIVILLDDLFPWVVGGLGA